MKTLWLLLSFLPLLTAQCASFENTTGALGRIFRGNTKRDYRDYDLESRDEYLKYRRFQKAVRNDEEKDILRRLTEEEKN